VPAEVFEQAVGDDRVEGAETRWLAGVTQMADVVHKLADRHWVQTPYRFPRQNDRVPLRSTTRIDSMCL
jgi:hypothetical protein